MSSEGKISCREVSWGGVEIGGGGTFLRSPRRRLASWMSLDWIVLRKLADVIGLGDGASSHSLCVDSTQVRVLDWLVLAMP